MLTEESVESAAPEGGGGKTAPPERGGLPVSLGRALNREQQEAVNRDRNAVVAAGAGSGKTSVLASRYVRLITGKGLGVDQILSLTFTRKAAAEMYQRIHGALREESRAAQAGAVPGAPDPAGEALKDFFRARIQTVDSYCASIVKLGGSRYGIRPDFTVDDGEARELAVRESLPFLISRVSHPALERLYREKRPPDIARGIFADSAFLYSRINEAPACAAGASAQFAAVCARWRAVEEKLPPLLDELAALAAGDSTDNFLVQTRPIAKDYLRLKSSFITEADIRGYFDALLDSPEDSVTAAEAHPLRPRIAQWLRLIHRLAYVKLTLGKKNSPAKAIVQELRRLFPDFSSMLVYALQGGITLSIMALLDEFQGVYEEKKRAQGLLTFGDVAHLARAILRDQKDIRDNEKAAFRAIMIDEFQDNNSQQKELLFLLAEKQDRHGEGIPEAADLEEEKLFFVGDEKQSIYRFRGADVSVFRELTGSFAAGRLSLGTNYRSSPQLIACYNALFGGSTFDSSGAAPLFQRAAVFPPAGKLPPYEADYSPLKAGTDEEGSLDIRIVDSGSHAEDDEDDSEDGEQLEGVEQEAAFTAAKIRELLDEKAESGQPRYKPDDIAVLFRTRKPQGLFEKHLRLLGIPYAGEGLSGFFADGPVNDIAAFLRLVAYPLDTEAYAISLRSPFAGLSLRGLSLCIAGFDTAKGGDGQGGGPGGPGHPFPESPPPLLGEGDRRAYEQGRRLYWLIREKAAGLSIGELVSELWYRQGYRYETIWNPRTGVHRELFDYLYSQAIKADDEGLSLAAFSDRLEAMREREEALEDAEIPLERPGAVRLLTIHKSKGLEFQVVFIVCCGKRARGRRNDKDIYYSSSHGLSFNPPLPPECAGLDKVKRNFFFEQDQAEERRKETAELRRLLYVAMTRARRKLFLTGGFPLGDGEGDLPSALATALEKKLEAKGRDNEKRGFQTLEGDSILDDGTLFGLLLPALLRDSAEGGQPGWPPCLTVGLIPPLTGQEIQNRERGGLPYPNTRPGLARFIRDASPRYGAAQVLHTPILRADHLNASAIGEETEGPENRTEGPENQAEKAGAGPAGRWRHDPALSGPGAADIFARADPILRRGIPELGFAEFGTIAHLCVEALLSGQEPRIPPRLAGRLSPAEAEVLREAGIGVAERFLASPLGQEARQAPCRRSEYPFRSLWEGLNIAGDSGPTGGETGIFINGVIDLLFEREHEVCVVDFKTDSVENPGEHIVQMALYERAARELRGKPCRVWLYYLRSGRAVEITDFSVIAVKS
jgi:ATP-dependent helicase/nuclease subunit A